MKENDDVWAVPFADIVAPDGSGLRNQHHFNVNIQRIYDEWTTHPLQTLFKIPESYTIATTNVNKIHGYC